MNSSSDTHSEPVRDSALDPLPDPLRDPLLDHLRDPSIDPPFHGVRRLVGHFVAIAVAVAYLLGAPAEAQPAFSDLQPPDGAVIGSGQGTLTGVVTGATYLAIDGVEVTPASDGSFSHAFDLGEGPGILQLHAEDGTGASTDRAHDLVVDSRAPVLTVSEPSSDVISASPLRVAGTYQEPHLASLTVAGVAATASGGTFSADVPLVEGAQEVSLAATDTLGHAESFGLRLVLDTVAPDLAVTEDGAPFAGGLYARAVVPVISAADATTEITTEILLDGAPFVSGATVSEEGAHVLDVTVTDEAGWTASARVEFTIDTTAPSLGAASPAAGTVLAQESASLVVETSGATRLRATGPAGSVEATGSGLVSLPALPLAEGTNEILLEAFDDAGNRVSASHRLLRDTTPPELVVTAPSDGDVIAASTVAVQGTARDPRLASVTVDGRLANLVGEGWSLGDAALVDGVNTLQIVATDSVGNESAAAVGVTRDTAAPTFRVLVDGAPLVSGATFAGAVTPVIELDDSQSDDGATVDASLDGAPFVSGSEISSEGVHELSVKVTSSAGVSASQLLVFTLDSTRPAFDGVSPASGTLQRVAEVKLTGSVTGARSVTVDGQPAQLYAGSFSAGPYALAEGPRTFVIVAAGANGLETEIRHTVERDSTPPVLSFSSPAEGALFGEPTISVSGEVQELHLETVTVNGTVATLSAGTWIASSVPLGEGSTTLTVRAEDAAGNVAEATRSVRLDTAAPSIELTEPGPGTVVPEDRTTVRGTVQDAELDRVEVNGVRATMLGDAAAGATWEAEIPLDAGSNALTAEAWDRLGRSASASGEIFRDAAAPSVQIVVPSEGARVASTPVEVRGKVTDEEGTTVKVNGLVALVDRGSWSITDIELVPGENRLLARATDAQGNEGVHTRYVTLDQEAPRFLDADPASGALALPVDTVFRLRFSEEMAPPSAGDWTLTSDDGSGAVAVASTATVQGDTGQGDELWITPSAPLPSESTVTLGFTAGLRDRAGNAVSPVPADLVYATTDVGAPDPPVLSFQPSSHLCSATAVLQGAAEPGSRVRVSGGESALDTRAADDGSFLFEVKLLADRLNVLELVAEDREGNVSLPTTVDVVHDCTGPRVADATFLGGDVAQDVTLTFSEAVEQGTVAPEVALHDAAGPVAVASTAFPSDDVAVLSLETIPTQPLELSVGTGVRDLAGNALAFPYQRLFGSADAESFVAGTVIDQSTGRPLVGTTAQVTASDGVLLSAPLPQQTTAEDGRFLVPVAAGTHDLTIARAGYTPVFRVTTAAAGEGSQVFDARLTPMTPAVSVGTGGGLVTADAETADATPTASLELTIPSGAFAANARVSLTAVGGQGLPALLPYGWSPRGAAWIEADLDLQAAATLVLPVTSPDGTLLDVVRLDPSILQWRVVDQVAVSGGAVSVPVATLGGYAAVQADEGSQAPPAALVGEVLGSSPTPTGAEVVSASIAFDPEVVLATQRARATVTYGLAAGSEDVPSGVPLTVVVEEELELLDGSIRRQAPFQADLLLYRDGDGTPTSRFFLQPSETARTEPIRVGAEDVTVRSYGDETVRGNVLGPDGGTVVSDAGDRLDVPAGALAEPAALALTRGDVASLTLAAPRNATVDAVVELETGGAVLATPARITVALATPPATGAEGLLLQVIPHPDGSGDVYRVLARLEPVTAGWQSAPIDPADLALPGVRKGGTLVAVELAAGHGWARGVVVGTDGMSSAGAVVSSASVDWLQVTDEVGRYALPLPVDDHVLDAASPTSGNTASVAVPVTTAGERVDVDLTLQVKAPWIVEITPADGSSEIPVGIQPTVRFSEPVDRTTLAEGVRLFDAGGGVEVATLVDHQGDLVRLLPEATLAPGTLYELRVGTAVRDLDGYSLNGPATTTFLTQEDPSTGTNLVRELVRTYAPDSQGLVHVEGLAGSVPGDTLVYVENRSRLVSTPSVTSNADGSFAIEVEAGLEDRLMLHVLIEGSSEDLMSLGPFLSADRKAAYIPTTGADFATADGYALEVQPETFDRPTWVRVETLAQPPLETPTGFTPVADLKLDFGGARAHKSLLLRIPSPGADPANEYLFSRYVEVLGYRGWMVMDLLHVDGDHLTNARDGEAKSARFVGAGTVEKRTASGLVVPATVYEPPDRHRVLTLEEARTLRQDPGVALFDAVVRRPARREAISTLRAPQLREKSSPPPSDPAEAMVRTLEPGVYQVSANAGELAWAALPLDRPDLVFAADGWGDPPFLAFLPEPLYRRISTSWILLPTRMAREYTLEIRDLSSGYLLAREVRTAPSEEMQTFSADVYGDTSPPVPVAGDPVRFFLIQPADDVSEREIGRGLTYGFAIGESESTGTLTVYGAPGMGDDGSEVLLYALDQAAEVRSTVAADGGFKISLGGVERQSRVLLVVSSKIGPRDLLQIDFSEALGGGGSGVDLFRLTETGSMPPNPVNSTRAQLGDGSRVELYPSTGWQQGVYRLRIHGELADAFGNTWNAQRPLDVDVEVEGSSSLATVDVQEIADVTRLGSLLVLAAQGGGVRIWDMTHPKEPQPLFHEDRGFQFPLAGAARGVSVDSHGRIVAVGGGNLGNGQLSVIDLLEIDPLAFQSDATTETIDQALIDGRRSSTQISDSLGGAGDTSLPEGLPRRVAVASNDDVAAWRLGDEVPPAGITLEPATIGPGDGEVQLTVSGSGMTPYRDVTVRNLLRGRWNRSMADEAGVWSVSLRAEAGDEIEIRRSLDSLAYVTVEGAGIAVVDVNHAMAQDEGSGTVAKSVLGYSKGFPVSSAPACDYGRDNVSEQPMDVAVLSNPSSSSYPLTVFTLYTGYGMGIQAAAVDNPDQLENVAVVCGAVDQQATLTSLEVVEDYPLADPGKTYRQPRDLALLSHAAGFVLVYDVTDRSAPQRLARIRLGKDDEKIQIAGLAVDRRSRRIFVSAFGRGIFVVDFDQLFEEVLVDADEDGIDDRVIEEFPVFGESVRQMFLMPELGLGFAAGSERGVTNLLVGEPTLRALAADSGPLREVGRVAPFGVPTAPESSTEESHDQAGVVRFEVMLPGLATSQQEADAGQQRIELDVLSTGPEGEIFDDAGDLTDLPTTAFHDLDPLELPRQADWPWESGHTLYLSEKVVLLADLRASVSYDASPEELEVCSRCDLVAEGVYAEPPTSDQELAELLSGHLLSARLAPSHEAALDAFYESSPYQRSELGVRSVPWDISPSIRQEPQAHPSLGTGDAAPGTLLHSGEMTLDATDLSLRARGFGVAFRRTYRNQTVGSGPLGPGWDHAYRLRLRELPNGDVELFDGRGRKELFESRGVGSYTPPKSWFVSLERTSAGWTLTSPGNERTRFDRWGRLVSVSDSLRIDEEHGSEMQFHYDVHSRLSRIDDTLGRPIRLEYDDDGHLTRMKDFAGREWKYVYDPSGRLERVETPAVEVRDAEGQVQSQPLESSYAYATEVGTLREKLAERDNLLSVTDPKQQDWLRLQWTDADQDGSADEVTSQIWGGHSLAISYDFDSRQTLVTDRRGGTRTYHLNAEGQTTKLVDSSQAVWRFTYDDEGLLQKTTEPLGRVTETTFDSGGGRRARGNALEVKVTADERGANGSSSVLTTTREYHSETNQPVRITSPKGRTTEIDRDEEGLPIRVIRAQGAEESATESFEYNAFGQVTRAVNPNGHVTEYDYFDLETGDDELHEGFLKAVTVDPQELNLRTELEVDELGRRVAITDPRGVRSESGYNALGWPVESRQAVTGSVDGAPPLSYVARTHYDANGNVSEREIPFGEGGSHTAVLYEHGVLDELLSVRRETGPGTHQWIEQHTDYDENFNPIRHTDGAGQVQETDYDARNLPQIVRRGLGANALATPITEQLTYDADRRLTVFADGRGSAWSRTYDGFGRVKESTDPLGNQRQILYDDHHNATLSKAIDAQGGLLSQLETDFDLRDRPFEVRRSLWNPADVAKSGGILKSVPESATTVVSRTVYDAASNVIERIDPKGRSTSFTYDAAERTKQILDAIGNQRELTYDAASNVVETVMRELDANGSVHAVPHTAAFDALGRMTTRRDALQNTWSYRYDARSQVTRQVDPEGFATHQHYDGLNRRTRETKPEGIRVEYGYDGAHRLVSYQDALGHQTTYEYDAANRHTKTIFPDQTAVSMTYDGAGNLAQRIDQVGSVVSYAWDPAHRIQSRTAAPAPGLEGPTTETFEHDGLDRLVSATAGSVSTRLAYDSLSHLVSETSQGRTTAYDLDVTGRRASTTYASGRVVDRVFDALDRPSQIVSGAEMLAGYGYRGVGAVHKKSLGNGFESIRTFDAARRPIDHLLTNGTGTTIFRESTTWTPRYLKSSITRGDLNGQTQAFAYDGAGRLRTMAQGLEAQKLLQASFLEKTSIGEDGSSFAEVFEYDAAQALTSRTRTVDGIAQTIASPPDASGRNRPSRIGDVDLAWDANGNLVQKGDLSFVYDWRNRLQRVEESGQTVAEYEYDVFNRRVETRVGDDTIETVYQGWREAEEYRNGTLRTERVFGNGLDEVVETRTDLDGNGTLEQVQVPVFDNTGNVALVADGSGKTLERYEYTSYGQRTVYSAALEPEIEQIRLVGDEIWIETNVEVLLGHVETAIDDGALTLERTDGSQSYELTATQPVEVGHNARRRLVLATSTAPPADAEVKLTLAAEAFEDEFQNKLSASQEHTFLWTPQIVLDTAAPEVQQIAVRADRLEIEWSETVDLASADAQIVVGGALRTWSRDTTGYRLMTQSDLTTGDYTLEIATGVEDLSGTPSAPFEASFTHEDGQDQVIHRAKHPREIDGSAIGNQYGFHGRPVDAETGLIYQRNRYFDPELGAFTTADPLGFVDGPSMYAFSRFNPSNFRDPLGLECLQIFGDEETKCSDYLPSMPEGQATKDYFENVEGATDSSNSGGERIRDGLQAAATAPFYVLEGLVAGIVNAPRELLLAMEEDAELRERVKELRGEHENWFEMARQLEAEGYDISYLVDGPGIAAAPLPGRPNLRTSRRGAWTSVSTDARSILKDVESRTKRKIPGSQRTRLADELRGTNHRQPVSKAEYRRLQAEYREQRAALIEAWERNTGQVWPRGAQAHHVIPTRYGGPNEWWNIHPAYQSVHQSGIHGSGSATQLVFPTPVRSSG